MAWLKKKKTKAGLEMPPPPPLIEEPAPKEEKPEIKEKKMDIPDKFHEVRFSRHPVEELIEEPISSPKEKMIPHLSEEEFKPVSEVVKPEIPEMPELPEIPELPKEKVIKQEILEGPIFIKSRDYQEVLGKINKIKENVQHTEDVFKKMNEIKNEKDKIFDEWKKSLEDIQRKLIYIEKSFFEV